MTASSSRQYDVEIPARLDQAIRHFFGSGPGAVAMFRQALAAPKATVSQWLSGANVPRARWRRQICDRFGISRRWLDFGVGKMLGDAGDVPELSEFDELRKRVSHLERRVAALEKLSANRRKI